MALMMNETRATEIKRIHEDREKEEKTKDR